MAEATEALDRLIGVMEKAAAEGAESPPRDAIDAALERPARQTQVASLGDSPVMARFRAELSDGLIRIDTLNQVLRLIAAIIERWPAR
jgi:hypothetical protein